VFNDVPIGQLGANIDHVVVGPGGTFTVNTKNRSGKVWLAPRTLLVNGIKTDYLPKAAGEAARAPTS
jgi:Nuclease-related domain.